MQYIQFNLLGSSRVIVICLLLLETAFVIQFHWLLYMLWDAWHVHSFRRVVWQRSVYDFCYFSFSCLIENPKVTVECSMYKTCDKKTPYLICHCCCCFIVVFSKWARCFDFMRRVLHKTQSSSKFSLSKW